MQSSTRELGIEYCERVLGDRLVYHVLFVLLFGVVGYLTIFVLSEHAGTVTEAAELAFVFKLSIYVILGNAFATPALSMVVKYYLEES